MRRRIAPPPHESCNSAAIGVEQIDAVRLEDAGAVPVARDLNVVAGTDFVAAAARCDGHEAACGVVADHERIAIVALEEDDRVRLTTNVSRR